MGKRKVTPKMVDRMRELRGVGWNHYRTACEVGVSQMSVNYYTRPGAVEEQSRRVREYHRKLKQDIVAFFGGKCSNPDCSAADWRILEVNHLNSGGKEDTKKYGGNHRLYRAILDGTRPTNDLNLLCASCNALYEHEVGRRKVGSPNYSRRVRAIKKIMGEHPSCVVCGNTDLRVLEINHLDGGGQEDCKKYGGNINLYRAIVNGTRPTNDLDIRCVNCNRLYDYERGMRDDGRGSRKADELPISELPSTLSQINQLRELLLRGRTLAQISKTRAG